MEINLGREEIVELQATYSQQFIQEKAFSKRLDAFGSVARLIQRPKPDDIEITAIQKRYEPFWQAVATARYVYDRRQTYHVPVTTEVQSVTFSGQEYQAEGDKPREIILEGVEHCIEEIRRELTLDAERGEEIDMRKYASFPRLSVAGLSALQEGGALVVVPDVRSSYLVRKLISLMLKNLSADVIHEERIDLEQVALIYRPMYAVEFTWKSKQKTNVWEFDALTGEIRAEGGQIKRQVVRILENDALFDVGADAIGTFVPGGGVAVKLGRMAARKALK